MGLWNAAKKMAQATKNVVLTPVDIVVDVATLGGCLTDEPESYTVRRIKKVAEDVAEAYEETFDDGGY